MKKSIIFLLLVSITYVAAAKKHKTLTKVMSLKTAHMGGTNGASVAWDPEHQKYYAAMAGNTYYPMGVYGLDGKLASDSTLETLFDVRGLWYNTVTKTLQSNGYKDFGMVEYMMDDKGMPEGVKKLQLKTAQPNEQSVGSYDTARNVLYFYDMSTGFVIQENFSGMADTVFVHLGIKKKKKIKDHKNSEISGNYNENTGISTNIPKAEIGLLNIKERQIELYNVETGLLKKILKLPTDAPVESSLNFSGCNGIYWLYDKKRREWKGYQ